MNRVLIVAACLCLLVNRQPANADGERDNDPTNVRRIPRAGVVVPAEREQALRENLRGLQQKIQQLQKQQTPIIKSLLPDVMIFERAVRCALDFNEFFSPKDLDKADALLAEGLSRAEQLLAGQPIWHHQNGLVVRGYISRIDQTVQPYGVVIPETYDFRRSVPTRCDIWFHGRGETLSEVNFIFERMKTAGRYTPDHTIVLHPYGRYSNAFKFAGEVDVLESLKDVQRHYRIDEDRISVRGFSMGGAACWQFAVHYSDRWFAANPGAGFSETPEFLKFFQKENLNPTPWETALWNMYDCNRWAGNLQHCPTIAYSGEKDIQKQAADVMEAALQKRGIRLRHIIGANMGHTIDDASKQIIEQGMASLAKAGRHGMPDRIHFETSTLKYNRMHWLTVDGMVEHWKPAKVNAAPESAGSVTYVVNTENVSALSLHFPAGTFPPSSTDKNGGAYRLTARITSRDDEGASDRNQAIVIPGDGPFSDGSAHLQAHLNSQGIWVGGARPSGLRKRHNLQGPIDDAFMDSFVFVRPTGQARDEAVGKWAEAELQRAIVHWRRHFRGDARVVNDTDVSDEQIRSANLVLWGDPGSNRVMARIQNDLPIQWQQENIKAGKRLFARPQQALIMIYPNPLNPDRYVVLNSSFTFRDYAYLNNARQVSMLPDWAVIDLETPPGNVWPGEVMAAGFFDESWQVGK